MTTPKIEISAIPGKGYAKRTRHNANSADLTLAVAVDFTTAGEKLTKKCAGSRFISVPFLTSPIEAARKLYLDLKRRGITNPVLNVAGNGIYTLAKHGHSQEEANAHMFEMLGYIHPHIPFKQVISGGQTGMDMAGVIAAHALGIDTRLTFPQDYIQRDARGLDHRKTPEDIRNQVIDGARQLSEVKAGKSGASQASA